MKLEETENIKLKSINNIQATTKQISNIHNSDIAENLNINKKKSNYKGKPSFKKWCKYFQRYGHSIDESRQKQQDNPIKPQKYKNQTSHFISK